MILKTLKFGFNIAAGASLGYGVSNLFESQPIVGGLGLAAAVVFGMASEAIKQYQDSKITKLIPIPTEQPEFLWASGITKEEFINRMTDELMRELREDEKDAGGTVAVCCIFDDVAAADVMDVDAKEIKAIPHSPEGTAANSNDSAVKARAFISREIGR